MTYIIVNGSPKVSVRDYIKGRWLQVDPRAEPRVGERVPYVIVNGPPAVPLIQLVRSPYDLLADPSLRVNARYYITRVIMPSLKRCFSLLGADVDAWGQLLLVNCGAADLAGCGLKGML
ncbi:hypothetical protein PR048_015429 [Dryococelus australis]|uniref:DNA-directed DNA polymerase n=1 Tax=Dryococelus australis TaxID=614101 RepID=A0ABQ9HH75_9NEOP|nr:hypothetical protein PR048_015429 [Dryococelus australis]